MQEEVEANSVNEGSTAWAVHVAASASKIGPKLGRLPSVAPESILEAPDKETSAIPVPIGQTHGKSTRGVD